MSRALLLWERGAIGAVAREHGLIGLDAEAESGRAKPAVIWRRFSQLWGLAFGGVATLFQTASAKTAGEAADVAQSMLVTTWNLAIAGGGIVGGLLLDGIGAGAFPFTLLALLTATLLVAWSARAHGFPIAERQQHSVLIN